MKDSRITMGMPATVEVVDASGTAQDIQEVYDYFTYVDEKFSTYKETSEISQINAGLLTENKWSKDMREVMIASELTKRETNGYFNIERSGYLDPSGYVKGWAIQNGATILKNKGLQNYYVDIAGDIQVAGHNSQGTPWRIGIRNPFNREEIIKTVSLTSQGLATSGTAARGQHIYNPHFLGQELEKVVSLTVIGPNVLDADRYATAAFAMGEEGIQFIATLEGFEAYQIDREGIATFTPGFNKYVVTND